MKKNALTPRAAELPKPRGKLLRHNAKEQQSHC